MLILLAVWDRLKLKKPTALAMGFCCSETEN